MQEVIVIKLGGRLLHKLNRFIPQIKEVRRKNKVIVIHGGREQLSEFMRSSGKEPVFIDGRRVTDEETLEMAKMVFGSLNMGFVCALEKEGVPAVGLSGCDGKIVIAEPNRETGLEGKVKKVNLALIKELYEKYVLVFLPLAFAQDKGIVNIDADDLATRIARALGAKMMIIGEMNGILGEDGKVIHRISTKELHKLIKSRIVSGGMIPKIEAAVCANLPKIWILNGNEENIILRALNGERIGTMIIGA